MMQRIKITYGKEQLPHKPPNYDQQCRDRMVGTRLKNLIAWFPVPKKTNCGSCNRMERKMNAWGPEKCRVKMPYILAKLKIAAKRRGLPFSERLVRILIEKAING
jgi:hypothetical protein